MCFIRFNGFSTWTMLQPNANAKRNIVTKELRMLGYNREQYGSNPFIYGPQYTEVFAG
jgi:hypothetical protein